MSHIFRIFTYMLENTEYDELYLRFLLGKYNPSKMMTEEMIANFEERELYERCKRMKKWGEGLSENFELEIVIDD